MEGGLFHFRRLRVKGIFHHTIYHNSNECVQMMYCNSQSVEISLFDYSKDKVRLITKPCLIKSFIELFNYEMLLTTGRLCYITVVDLSDSQKLI